MTIQTIQVEKDMRDAIENKKILKERVVAIEFNEELETDIVTLDLGDGVRGIIKKEDLDYEVNWRSLVPFIGKEIFFVPKSLDEEQDIVYCSRKEAQELMRDGIIERLESGEEIEAVMTGSTDYGAYLEIDGIYCMLKNRDFGDSHVPVRDVLSEGDTIKIKLLRIGTKSGRITVEAVEKYNLPKSNHLIDFKENQVVVGKVNTVKPWGVFVTIASGFDALCSIPPTIEVEEGIDVAMKIVQVDEDKSRVKGKILKAL